MGHPFFFTSLYFTPQEFEAYQYLGGLRQPLFNNKGELIEIVSAKQLGTENVTYQIKTSY